MGENKNEVRHTVNNLVKTAVVSTLAGGLAGLTVDVSLYPLDAFKTRLQSAGGFLAAGGFSRPYAGISAVVVSSIPSAALFFAGYESTKYLLLKTGGTDKSLFPPFLVHMAAAGIGEVVACFVRVPAEIVKQRTQAKKASSVMQATRHAIATDGFFGLWRGFGATVCRDIPFAFIQYPLWELLKDTFPNTNGHSALAGFIAGGVTAAVTTPFDVIKTRIMLTTSNTIAGDGKSASVLLTFNSLWREGGVRVLFAGVLPRTAWISLGGAIFLGSYDTFKSYLV